MCGITGFYLKENSFSKENLLVKMNDTITHRGPDDSGIYISPDKKVGLAQRRLSIIDLSPAGHQPMCNEDESIWIVFNGEIYNYIEIKKELLKKEHVFKSNTDTEVIIHAYEEYGSKCINYFEGMFAFVIYDIKKKLLFLARDRFGIKPLYYFLKDGTFGFASEIKALTLLPDFKKELNYGAIGDFFKYRYIPSPKSIWKHIYKIPHGHYAFYDLSSQKFTIKEYYNLLHRLGEKSSSLEEIEFLMDEAVKKRLISDVEVGTLLSGGIDSSAISAIASKHHPHIKSFSIGFIPETYSELSYSKIAAESIKTNHITEIIDDMNWEIIDKIYYYYDEPIADSSCIPTYILCNMVSKHVKVALSGDGGDEVFSGYKWYKKFLKLKKINDTIDFIKNIFRKDKNQSGFEDFYNKLLLNRFDNEKFKKLFSPEIYTYVMEENEKLFEKYLNNPLKSVRAIQYIDINTFLVDDILVKVDRASMAHSLEVRVPFLDHKLVEAVFSLSEKEFPANSTGKPVMKKILKNKLPDQIINRSKKGFSAPVTKWKGYKDIGSYLLNGNTIKDNIIEKTFILDLINNRYRNSNGMLWMIYIFEIWYQKHYKNSVRI